MGLLSERQRKKLENPPSPLPPSTSSKIKQLEEEIKDWKNKYQLILKEKDNLQIEHNKLIFFE